MLLLFLFLLFCYSYADKCYSNNLATEIYPGSWLDGTKYPWYNDLLDSESSCFDYEKLHMNSGDSKWGKYNNGYSDQKLLYSPKNCTLDSFDSKKFVEMLTSRKISLVLVGDSMMGQFASWLKCTLKPLKCETILNSHLNTSFICDLNEKSASKLLFVRSNLLHNTSKSSLSDDFQKYNINKNDVAIFNYGEHYREDYKKLGNLIINEFSNIPENWPRLIWRERLSSHHKGHKRGVFTGRQHMKCINRKDVGKEDTITVINKIWENLITPSIILKINLPTRERYNEHMPSKVTDRFNQKFVLADCLHYFLKSSVYRLLGTMTQNLINEVLNKNIYTKSLNKNIPLLM